MLLLLTEDDRTEGHLVLDLVKTIKSAVLRIRSGSNTAHVMTEVNDTIQKIVSKFDCDTISSSSQTEEESTTD